MQLRKAGIDLTVVLVLAVSQTACGTNKTSAQGGAKQAAARNTDGTAVNEPGASGDTDAVAAQQEKSTPDRNPQKAAQASGPATPPSTVYSAKDIEPRPVPSKATVDTSCVKPGDLQGLTITTTPSDKVMYDTVYSDKTSRMIRSDYTEGFGDGTADATGVFRVTWHIPSTAPTGPATLNYAAQGQFGTLQFDVAKPNGACS